MCGRRQKVLRPDRDPTAEARSPPARSACFSHPVQMSQRGVRAAAVKRRQIDRQFGRKTDSEQLGCCATPTTLQMQRLTSEEAEVSGDATCCACTRPVLAAAGPAPPFVAAAWCATCRVCLAAMHAALPAWAAVVAMAPLARMRSLRLPSAATSLRRARPSWPPAAASPGGEGGAAVSRLRHRPAFLMPAIPVAIQCPWKTDHFFFCFPFGGLACGKGPAGRRGGAVAGIILEPVLAGASKGGLAADDAVPAPRNVFMCFPLSRPPAVPGEASLRCLFVCGAPDAEECRADALCARRGSLASTGLAASRAAASHARPATLRPGVLTAFGFSSGWRTPGTARQRACTRAARKQSAHMLGSECIE
eukprot:scaffold56008_cov65-Phaeocystis_antarctica.AAC.2